MHFRSFGVMLLCTLLVLYESASLGLAQGEEVIQPEKPVFPDTFQVELEALFKEDSSQVDGTLYFDKGKNRAAVDLIWKGDRRRMIYNFDTNELITIQGSDCTVDKIPDDPESLFFPFTVDKKTKKKIMAPAEDVFKFRNSTYYGEDLIGEIPFYLYTTQVDVPKYNLKGCNVTHTFTETNFETATCKGTQCKPVLSRISVHCPNTEEAGEAVSHLYQFFRFDETSPDDSVFHAHSGVFCPRNGTKNLPNLPNFFSFTYDMVFQDTQVSSSGSVRSLHKELWYDGDLRLIRVDDYDDKKVLQYTKVYDFLNRVSYVVPAKLEEGKQAEMGELTADMTFNKASLLPEVIFSKNLEESNSTPVYVGMRNIHGLNHDVWSVMAETPEGNFRDVTDIYFLEIAQDTTSTVNNSKVLLSYMEFFAYERKAETKKLKLVQRRYIPLNDFKTVSRDWSAFDVSACFTVSQKKRLQIKIEGPYLEIGSVTYGDVLEKLYLEIVTISGGTSIIRISGLKMTSSNEEYSVFEGWILENPSKLGFGRNNSEPDLETACDELEKGIKLGRLSFNTTDENGEVSSYTVVSLNCTDTGENKVKGESTGYSGGAMAGIAIVMLIVGIVLGVAGLVTFLRSRKGSEAQKLVNSS